MQALNGQHLSFTTLPFTPENNVPVPGYPGPQDVNIIDVPAIQKLVAERVRPGAGAPGDGHGHPPARPRRRPPGDGRRLQRQPRRGRPGQPGLAGADRLGYNREGRERLRADASGTAGDAGLLRRGARRHAQQIAVQFGATATALSTLSADRGGADRLDRHQVPAGHRPAASPRRRGTQSIGAQVIGARAARPARPRPRRRRSTANGRQRHGRRGHRRAEAPYGIPCVY